MKAPPLRPNLTVKSAEPSWIRPTIFKVQLSNHMFTKLKHNTGPCFPANDQTNVQVKQVWAEQ